MIRSRYCYSETKISKSRRTQSENTSRRPCERNTQPFRFETLHILKFWNNIIEQAPDLFTNFFFAIDLTITGYHFAKYHFAKYHFAKYHFVSQSTVSRPWTADVEKPRGGGGGGVTPICKGWSNARARRLGYKSWILVSLGVLTTKHYHFSCQSIVRVHSK